MPETVSQQQISELTEDASLLLQEAQTLQSLIETVPYGQSTPEESSIQDKLHLLDELQRTYFHPVMMSESGIGSARSGPLESLTEVVERLKSDGEREAPEIQSILESLSEQRSVLLDHMKTIPAGEWDRTIRRAEEDLSLYEFALEMVQFDQKILKEVAGMVMVFQQDSWTRREINQQASARNNQMNSNNRQE